MSKESVVLTFVLGLFLSLGSSMIIYAQETDENARNPIIWADVSDPSVIRVGDAYYMSSTTMHMNPGVPIMKSSDLVDWKTVNYAYDILANNDAMNLRNGQDAYGRGSWASSLRYHDDTFYVVTFSYTTGKTHIYQTDDIENGLTIPRAKNPIKFKVEGCGKIVATDNGDPTNFVPFHSHERRAFSGMALVIICSHPGESGQITVTANSPGLQSAQVIVKSQ